MPTLTLTPLDDVLTPAPAGRLGLTAIELDELLTAVGDREDAVGTDARARLARARRALEAELARLLDT